MNLQIVTYSSTLTLKTVAEPQLKLKKNVFIPCYATEV